MTVYFDKARQAWRYDFRHARVRHAGYCRDPETGARAATVTAARRIEQIARARVLQAHSPAPHNPRSYTLAQAIAARMPLEQRRKDWIGTRHHLEEIGAYFGLATPVEQITDQRIREYQSWCLKQSRRTYVGGAVKQDALGARAAFRETAGTRAIATANHYVKTLLRVLRQAHATRQPVTGRPLLDFVPRVQLLKEPAHAPRPIALADLARIRARALELGPTYEHVRDLVELNYHFGLRLREGTHATIAQCDFAAKGFWLEAAGTKSNRGEFVPASRAGLALLRRLVERATKAKQTRLILWRRAAGAPLRPLDNPGRTFNRVLADLGLDGRHTFHNIKASFVTAIARTAPAAVVQRAARHKDFRTTQRYLAVVDADLRAAIEALPAPGPARVGKGRGR